MMITLYENKKAAAIAEKLAIRDEKPRFNTIYNDRSISGALARMLYHAKRGFDGKIKITESLVHKWIQSGKIPKKYCNIVSYYSRIKKTRLRPDIYGRRM